MSASARATLPQTTESQSEKHERKNKGNFRRAAVERNNTELAGRGETVFTESLSLTCGLCRKLFKDQENLPPSSYFSVFQLWGTENVTFTRSAVTVGANFSLILYSLTKDDRQFTVVMFL